MESVFGYGSLVDEKSAKRTMPSARNFRRAVLLDYMRVFSIVSISGLKLGKARPETNEVAALAVKSQPGGMVPGFLFEISSEDLALYLEREHRYRQERVSVRVLDNLEKWDGQCPTLLDVTSAPSTENISCWTVVEQTDDEYLMSMPGGAAEWHERVGQYYGGRVWGRTDIYPMQPYMEHVVLTLLAGLEVDRVLAALWLQCFLCDTRLSDGTTVSLYLASHSTQFQSLLSQLIQIPQFECIQTLLSTEQSLIGDDLTDVTDSIQSP